MQTLELRSSSTPDSDPAATQCETWIDMEVSDGDGREWLASQSGLDRSIVGRLLEPTSATYWRRFGHALHLNMHAPVPGERASMPALVDFGVWLEPGRIITVRRGRVPALESAAEACTKGDGPSSAWELILSLLSAGLSRVERNLHTLAAAIDQLEDEALTGEDEPAIDRVAELQKRLVYARRFRMPLANMLSFISAQPESAIDDTLRDEFEELVSAVAQHQELLAFTIERASALQGQIRDQLADSMNTATYRFTWVATVFLPLSFLTGLLGINVAGIPGDHNPLAFWLFCGALCVIAAIWGVAVGRATRPYKRRSRGRDA